MPWISKKEIKEFENKIERLERVLLHGVKHKLSAKLCRTHLDMLTLIDNICLKLYIDGVEFQIKDIPELCQWYDKIENIDDPIIDLESNNFASIRYEVKDDKVKFIKILTNYNTGNYVFITYEHH